jgi:acetyl esterase/lipase
MFNLNPEWKNSFRVFLLLVVILFSVSCKREQSNDANSSYREFNLENVDGSPLKGRLYTPSSNRNRPPGLILLHMAGSSVDSWHSFAEMALGKGYMSIAITQQTPRKDTVHDVSIAKNYLVDQGAHPSNLFIVGAGVGANVGLTYAQSDLEIQGIVLISPGLTLNDLPILSIVENNSKRPMLFMASEGDSYSHSSVITLQEIAPVYAELKTYLGSVRGTDLLDAHPAAGVGILEWIEPILK